MTTKHFVRLVAIVASGLTLAAGSAQAAVQSSMLEDTADMKRIEFHFDAPVQTGVRINGQQWTLLNLANESIAVQAGEPALPDVRRSVRIGDTDAVVARLQNGSYYDIPGIQIAPSKGAITRDIDPSTVPFTFGKTYDSAGFWPAETVSIAEPHIIRNARGAVVTVRPLQWNPATNTLRVWTEMTVDVETVGTATHNVLQRASLESHSDNASWQAIYKRHFINYTPQRVYDPLDHSGDMLIICHDAWLANIQPLADHKNSIGINTTVVGISTVGNSPASIEAYIDGMYDAGDLCYVLLVGDAQHISAYTSADNGLSDPIYAKMTADDYPDLFVGRFSAESAADVDTQVARTITYETEGWTQRPEYMHVLGISSNQGPGDDGEMDNEHIQNILNQLIDYGYTESTFESDPNGNMANAIAAINDGVGTIAYAGHGSQTCWSNGAPLCINDVNGLTNTDMLPWSISVGCVNGDYASGTCFAEAWLRATDGSTGAPTGAIGVYASTINQYWDEPMSSQDETYDLFTAEQYTTLGVLLYAGSCMMMDDYGQSGVDMYNTWHLFGDPSVVVQGLAAPPTGMRVAGTGFAAEGPLGGPFAPDTNEFVLSNYEDVAINFDVDVDGGDWLSVFPLSGQIPVGGEVVVTASLTSAASDLPNGNFTANINFTNLDSNDGDTSKNVSITVGVPVPVIEWTLDSDPGWSMDGEWAFGQPTGQGGNSYGNADPTSGATGQNVLGVNLNGDYSLTPGGPYALTTNGIDCSNYTDTSVSFERWLNCDYQSYAINTFQISNDGETWSSLWENPSATETADGSWNLQEFDISGVADGQSMVYLRWTHTVSDFAWAYSGWNIDDITISAVDGSAGEPCPGDVSGDGVVNVDDILEAVSGFGDQYDVNDILVILENFGSNC